jgi:hypothetical protein
VGTHLAQFHVSVGGIHEGAKLGAQTDFVGAARNLEVGHIGGAFNAQVFEHSLELSV